MEVLYILTLCLMVFGTHAAELTNTVDAEANEISRQVIDTLEALKPQMACGWPEVGIPALAPLVITEYDHDNYTAEENYRFGIFWDDFSISGLNNYKIINLKVNPIFSRINLNILLSKITLGGNYYVNLIFFRRSGGIRIIFKKVSIVGQVKYSLNLISRNVQIREISVIVTVKKVVSRIDLSSNWFLNRLINRLIANFISSAINNHTEFFSNMLNDILVPIVNNLIANFTLEDIIGIITGGRESKCNVLLYYSNEQ